MSDAIAGQVAVNGERNDSTDVRQLKKGASVSIVLKVIGLSVGFAFTMLVTNMFGAAAWGTFSLSFAILTLATILARLGADSAILRLIAASRLDLQHHTLTRRYFTDALVIVSTAAVTISILLFSGAPFIANGIFNKPELTSELRIASLGVLPLAIGYTASQALRALHRTAEYVFFDLVARFGAALIVLAATTAIIGPTFPVMAAFVAGCWCVTLMNLAILRRRIERLAPPQSERRAERMSGTFSRILEIGLPLVLASSITFLKGWIDTIMLGIYAPQTEIGVYNVALKLAGVVAMPLVAVNTVAAPKFAEAFAAAEQGRLQSVARSAANLATLGSLPLMVLFIAFAAPIMALFGEEMRGGSASLVLLTVGSGVNALCGSVGYLLQMSGRHTAFRNITLITTVAAVLLNWYLIPRYGILGAAASTCIAQVSWNGILLLYVRATMSFWPIAAPRRLKLRANE